MIIKWYDTQGNCIIHDDITGVQVSKQSFMNFTDAKREIEQVANADDTFVIDPHFFDEHRSDDDCNVPMITIVADTKDGGVRIYRVGRLAYVCNDDGRTIHKVEPIMIPGFLPEN